tara:strand:- start:798 stop:935 length:138 start_codon:yes stop_codon:yes gene_type:complete
MKLFFGLSTIVLGALGPLALAHPQVHLHDHDYEETDIEQVVILDE